MAVNDGEIGYTKIFWVNFPDTGYRPDSEFKIQPDPDIGYRIPISKSDCVKNWNSLIHCSLVITQNLGSTPKPMLYLIRVITKYTNAWRLPINLAWYSHPETMVCLQNDHFIWFSCYGRGNGLVVESRPRNLEVWGLIPRSAAAGRRSSALSTLNYCVVLPRWCCVVPG